jgi:hypothetical protein
MRKIDSLQMEGVRKAGAIVENGVPAIWFFCY